MSTVNIYCLLYVILLAKRGHICCIWIIITCNFIINFLMNAMKGKCENVSKCNLCFISRWKIKKN